MTCKRRLDALASTRVFVCHSEDDCIPVVWPVAPDRKQCFYILTDTVTVYSNSFFIPHSHHNSTSPCASEIVVLFKFSFPTHHPLLFLSNPTIGTTILNNQPSIDSTIYHIYTLRSNVTLQAKGIFRRQPRLPLPYFIFFQSVPIPMGLADYYPLRSVS